MIEGIFRHNSWLTVELKQTLTFAFYIFPWKKKVQFWKKSYQIIFSVHKYQLNTFWEYFLEHYVVMEVIWINLVNQLLTKTVQINNPNGFKRIQCNFVFRFSFLFKSFLSKLFKLIRSEIETILTIRNKYLTVLASQLCLIEQSMYLYVFEPEFSLIVNHLSKPG